MSALNVGQQIHDFRVDAFLKSMYGYEQTYLATSVQEEHKKVLLKLYDVMEFPSRQLSEGGTLMEGISETKCIIGLPLYICMILYYWMGKNTIAWFVNI